MHHLITVYINYSKKCIFILFSSFNKSLYLYDRKCSHLIAYRKFQNLVLYLLSRFLLKMI